MQHGDVFLSPCSLACLWSLTRGGEEVMRLGLFWHHMEVALRLPDSIFCIYVYNVCIVLSSWFSILYFHVVDLFCTYDIYYMAVCSGRGIPPLFLFLGFLPFFPLLTQAFWDVFQLPKIEFNCELGLYKKIHLIFLFFLLSFRFHTESNRKMFPMIVTP